MTATIQKPPAAAAAPKTRTVAAAGKKASRPWRWDEPAWAAARLAVRYPKSVTALSAAVAMFSPVTVREATGAFVGVSTVVGIRLWRSGLPEGKPSLTDVANFRKRKSRVRRRWVAVMHDCGLTKPAVNGAIDKRRPRLLRVSAEPLGVRVLTDGSPVSAGVDAFLAVADKLRAGFKSKSVKINPSGHNIEIHLRYDEPFTRIIRPAELPAPTRPLHVVVGLDEDGAALQKDLRLPHLFVGAQGAGKSSETWMILRALLSSRVPFRVRVFDPKGGQEFTDLEAAAWEYVRDPTKWTEFLEHSHRALSARTAALRSAKLRKVTEYTTEFPLDVMVIDELITAMAFGGSRKVKVNGTPISAEDAFMTYLSTARSAGFTVLASSQLAQKEILGKVRGLFGYVTCLRVAPTEKELVDILLGSGASKAYPAHHLPQDERFAGIGYASTPRGVVKYRAAFLTDHERAQVARGIGAWKKRLTPEDAS